MPIVPKSLALLVSIVTILLSGSARAGYAQVIDGARVLYAAGAGERNRVIMVVENGYLRIFDHAGATAGPSCVSVPGTPLEVRCPVYPVVSYLNDQDDEFVTFAPVFTEVHGMSGADTITNVGQQQFMAYGGPGDDTLTGSVGSDTLMGGEGNDTIDGGGSPYDTVSFLDCPSGVTFNLQYESQTTSCGLERVTNVENISGSEFDDTLTGTNGPNRIMGWSGSDQLWGSDGDDYLSGGPGADWLSGGAHADDLVGGDGADYMFGDSGDDTFNALEASTTPPGPGVTDHVFCGPDFDTGSATSVDLLYDCE